MVVPERPLPTMNTGGADGDVGSSGATIGPESSDAGRAVRRV
jgi:hypothetical protein